MHASIEDAQPEDAAEIAAIQTLCVAETHRGLLPEEMLDPTRTAARTRHWGAWLRRTRVRTTVARIDGSVVGFVSVQPAPDGPGKPNGGELAALFVRPDNWGRGIGSRLCARALSDARADGFEMVFLWVLESNERAKRLYAGQGFRPDGARRVFVERRDGAVHEERYVGGTSPM